MHKLTVMMFVSMCVGQCIVEKMKLCLCIFAGFIKGLHSSTHPLLVQ